MHDMNRIVGACDILFLTLDTLRFDVAQECFRKGSTPNLARLLPSQGWEERHAPGTFTFASHQAFFAGFLPTPARPGKHPRLFALRFEGSETTTAETCVLDGPNIVAGLRTRGYHTLCIGGVGFFNRANPLGNVLPGLFAESHWRPAFAVTNPASTRNQVGFACRRLAEASPLQRLFLFVNVSAVHQPNCGYLAGASADSLASHAAALEYVDAELPPLFEALRRRGPAFCILCSDHGTAYGEEGFVGHRLAHPAVWTVPYTDFLLPALDA
jgi:hypothetical protein